MNGVYIYVTSKQSSPSSTSTTKSTNGDSQQQCIFCHRSKPMSWWLLHTEDSMPESSQFLAPSPVCRVKPKAAGFTQIGAHMEPNTRLILLKPTAERFNEHKDLLQYFFFP
jgi:hypothetical protein